MSSFPKFDFKSFEKRYGIVLTPLTSNTTIPTPKNDNTLDTLEKRLKEKAVIIENDAKIPYDWALLIAKIQLRDKPKSITEEKWRIIVNNSKILVYLIQDIISHQWTISDIFGCHPVAPEKRFDVMGLLMLLKEDERITEVSENVIRIQSSRGSKTGYYRRYDRNCLVEQSYLYEI